MRQLFCEHEVVSLRTQANIWKAVKNMNHRALPPSLRGFPGGTVVKNPAAMQETQEMQVRSLGWEDPLEKGKATHSSIAA